MSQQKKESPPFSGAGSGRKPHIFLTSSVIDFHGKLQ